MNLAANILGTSAVDRLRESAAGAVLQIGSDKLTRADLAGVECYNFHAARLLSHVLRELDVRNLRDVYEKIPPSALALPNLGVISLAVLGAAFEAKGIGGQAPLESYVRRHLVNGNKVVTFDTLKKREHAEVANERKARKRRKASRRDRAQQLRVDRFTERAG